MALAKVASLAHALCRRERLRCARVAREGRWPPTTFNSASCARNVSPGRVLDRIEEPGTDAP